MPTIQTPWATGQDTPPRPQTAGAAHVARYFHSFAVGAGGALADADVIDMGPLPPFARVSEVTLIAEGAFAGVTCTVGLINGSGVVGAEFFAAGTALTGMLRSTVVAGHVLAPSETPRSIGIDFSALVAAGAKSVTLLVTFYEG